MRDATSLLQVVLTSDPSDSALSVLIDSFNRDFDQQLMPMKRLTFLENELVSLSSADRMEWTRPIFDLWLSTLYLLSYKEHHQNSMPLRVTDVTIDFDSVEARLLILRWLTDPSFFSDVVYPFLRNVSRVYNPGTSVKIWKCMPDALETITRFVHNPVAEFPGLINRNRYVAAVSKTTFPKIYEAIHVEKEVREWSWRKFKYAVSKKVVRHQVNPHIAGFMRALYDFDTHSFIVNRVIRELVFEGKAPKGTQVSSGTHKNKVKS